ncbi:DUF4190 domain-containing protein [Paludicola sp. MB14-C6]|uniref:DUF4190 domain-containing protein n=1 Tax=Paludihabitans sp. MB14-C6 TaxID=3070656 RepID=UPI0027DBEC64|nr:DUF4190 domain-containing protein [Paludicola sp. MB14-C6]WMJ24358.1 DUF4190 domain-containing protein [Paludicola sp. MB14-C6]
MNEFENQTPDLSNQQPEQPAAPSQPQQPYVPPQYQQPPFQPQYQQPKEKKGMAIAALVLGICSIVFSCAWYLAIPAAIIGIILGVLGMKTSGKTMAIVGIVLSAIGIICGIAFAVIGFAFAKEIMENPYFLKELQ